MPQLVSARPKRFVDTPEPERMKRLALRADQIVEEIAHLGPRQVRLVGCRVLSYCYPAPRGYGVHGVLVGIYGNGVVAQWILDDLVSLIDKLTGDIEPKQE